MKRTTGFKIDGTRYDYDFGECTYAEGWAQVDTWEDASYYGNWINPTTLEWQSFAEGDTTHIKFETEAEMIEFAREFCARMNAKIDPGLGDEMKARFQALGLADLLH